MTDKAEVPVELLKAAAEKLRAMCGETSLVGRLEDLIPRPPKERYYVLYAVDWQPDDADDPETNPPMDFQHKLLMKDPRCTTYGMEQIGPLEAITEWVKENTDEA